MFCVIRQDSALTFLPVTNRIYSLIWSELTSQFLVQVAAGGDREGADKLVELDRTVLRVFGKAVCTVERVRVTELELSWGKTLIGNWIGRPASRQGRPTSSIQANYSTGLTLFSSNTRKTSEANLLGSPWGKNWQAKFSTREYKSGLPECKSWWSPLPSADRQDSPSEIPCACHQYLFTCGAKPISSLAANTLLCFITEISNPTVLYHSMLNIWNNEKFAKFEMLDL